MATYQELHDLLITESVVKNKVKVALLVAAKAVFDEDPGAPNHSTRLVWARSVLSNLDSALNCVFPILLASFKDQTINAIKNCTDSVIQQAVDSHIDFLAV